MRATGAVAQARIHVHRENQNGRQHTHDAGRGLTVILGCSTGCRFCLPFEGVGRARAAAEPGPEASICN